MSVIMTKSEIITYGSGKPLYRTTEIPTLRRVNIAMLSSIPLAHLLYIFLALSRFFNMNMSKSQ